MRMNHSLQLLSVLIAIAGPAAAQAPPPATPPPQTAPPAPSNTNCTPTRPEPRQGTLAPEGSTATGRTEPLSEKLAKSDGVLCPPTGVDPEIRAPTPDAGTTPVIPPPGSPGGDPRVRPK
ncbi:MAG: hypothetical protein ACJ8EF_10650 [Bradyrhizobium sp.]